MIPPSLLNVTYYFSLLPVWEQEPAPTEPCSTPAAQDGSGDTATEQPNAQPSGQPAADADGVNDQVAMRMVLKGYKLTAVPQWEAEANAGYERWVEDRSDDDADRQRQDQRARAAARPSPHAPSAGPEADSSPPASCDSAE